MNVKNHVRFEFQSLPENVALARTCVSAFASQLDCTLDDIEEIKLVVSEAVSNSIIHGYNNAPNGQIVISVSIFDDNTIDMVIEDYGKGIVDIEQALEPTFSTDPVRMGLGFTFMKSFMDEMEVFSKPDEGTSVRLRRNFAALDREAYA